MRFLVLHHLDPCQKVGKSLVTQYEPRWEGKYKHHPAFISPDDFQCKHQPLCRETQSHQRKQGLRANESDAIVYQGSVRERVHERSGVAHYSCSPAGKMREMSDTSEADKTAIVGLSKLIGERRGERLFMRARFQ